VTAAQGGLVSCARSAGLRHASPVRFLFCSAIRVLLLALGTASISLGQTPRVTFGPVTSTDLAAPDSAGAAVGDFNQDGHLDLLVSSKAANGTNVNMFAGDGTGSLVRAAGFTFVQATAVVSADFNGDGYLDAVVTQDVRNKDGSYGDTVCGSTPGIALALGPAFVSPRCLIAPPRSIAVQAGDFDGDGRPEIAVVSASAQGLKIYKLTFVPFLTYSAISVAGGHIAARSMAPPVDLNGDGALDLVVGFAGGVKAFLGNGDGTFTAPAHGIAAGGPAAAIDVALINADEHPDIAWVESGVNGRVIVGLGNGNGTFETQVIGRVLTPTPGLTGVAVGDIDHDGRTDIVAADNGAARIRVYFGNGDGTFVTEVEQAPTANPKLLKLRDWDEDGDLDLAVLDGSIAGMNAVGWMVMQAGTRPADSDAPAVSVTSPAGEGNVEGRIAIAAIASDNLGVTHVDFYADGVLIARSAGPPYVVSWDTAAVPNGRVGLEARAYDAAGNVTQSSAVTVTVANAPPKDGTPPLISVPADAVIDATGPTGAVFTYEVTATDNVDGVVPATCAPPSGATFAFGPAIVVCSATDAAGNTASASFAVIVEDLTPPGVTVPADAVLEATSAAGAAFVFAASANDAVDGSLSAACDQESGATFALGATPVTCTATDANSNTASAVFTVTVTDTTAPVINVPADAVLEATSPGGAVYTFAVAATDVVDGEVTPTCSPASGTIFSLGLTPVMCTATDAHGNNGWTAFTVTVTDTTAPEINVPGDGVLEAISPDGVAYAYTASASDVVDGAVTTFCVPESGAIFAVGETSVTCTATDTYGNIASAAFTVTVLGPPDVLQAQ
jgi:hypothetical protein